MKKVIIYLGLLTLATSLGGLIVGAEEITTEQPVDITTRAQVRAHHFSSKPPKKYKGMTLIGEKKVKDGYIGYYVY